MRLRRTLKTGHLERDGKSKVDTVTGGLSELYCNSQGLFAACREAVRLVSWVAAYCTVSPGPSGATYGADGYESAVLKCSYSPVPFGQIQVLRLQVAYLIQSFFSVLHTLKPGFGGVIELRLDMSMAFITFF